MTIEQLQAARAEKWRQKSNPVLSLEDAAQWTHANGMCFFLPRRNQFPAPFPSFVEAVTGSSNPTPSPAAIQDAFSLAIRLFAAKAAAPLNLLGTVSERPDFIASPEALPYVFSLRGDHSSRRGPETKGSQLAADIWKQLRQGGALTAPELQEKLGRGVSESAVLRALTELWSSLYVLPIYTEGQPAAWALFDSQFPDEVQSGSRLAQSTALSALISLYLDSVIAASPEEVEVILSPLSSRSRIREVARGLLAMRQLSVVSVGQQTLLCITGGLPEFPPVQEAPAPAAEGPIAQAPQPLRKPQMARPPQKRPLSGRTSGGRKRQALSPRSEQSQTERKRNPRSGPGPARGKSNWKQKKADRVPPGSQRADRKFSSRRPERKDKPSQ